MTDLATVKILHNTRIDERGFHTAFIDGYRAGDPLRRVLLTHLDRADTDMVIAEEMFEVLNVDESYSPRPALTRRYRTQRNRSLSVGDVVVIDHRAYAVAAMGYTEVPVPREAGIPIRRLP